MLKRCVTPAQVYAYYRRIQHYSPYASAVSTLMHFGAHGRVPALKHYHREVSHA